MRNEAGDLDLSDVGGRDGRPITGCFGPSQGSPHVPPVRTGGSDAERVTRLLAVIEEMDTEILRLSDDLDTLRSKYFKLKKEAALR